MKFLIVFLSMIVASICFGQDPVFTEEVAKEIDSTLATKIGAFMAGAYVFLWGLGEFLTRISIYTKNKWDNKAAHYISQALWFIGAFAGRMGWKLPKAVIMVEADKIKAKEKL